MCGYCMQTGSIYSEAVGTVASLFINSAYAPSLHVASSCVPLDFDKAYCIWLSRIEQGARSGPEINIFLSSQCASMS